MLNHGGQLQQAMARYPKQQQWLDLSTGIAPWSWPVPPLPTAVWQRLPESDLDLRRAAATFYGCNPEQLLSTAGSQVAIETIPRLLPKGRVAIPHWGYGEHRLQWQRHGHELSIYRTHRELLQLLEQGVNAAVVINPCNPTGETWSLEQLSECCQRLSGDGVLVVDEAFADLDGDTLSSAMTLQHPRVVVLRSVGKFFGMAGLRLGFVHSAPAWQQLLTEQLPLWGVSHPALWLGERMLSDSHWHRAQRARIRTGRDRLLSCVRQTLPACRVQAGPLFVTVTGESQRLSDLHQACVQQGVLLRYFQPQQGETCLRIGLADDDQWSHFDIVWQSACESLVLGAETQ